VLVTLPLGVLKGPKGPRFSPALPEKERALSLLEMGSAVKLELRFLQAGWDTSQASLLYLDEQDPFHVFWSAHPGRFPGVIAWAGGPKALRLAGLSEEVLVDKALDTLASALRTAPAKLRQSFQSSAFHDWHTDPYTLGAYSYGGVGGEAGFALLAEPVQNTLFFAGEATHPDKNGTVDGAVETGVRAAKEIRAALMR